MKAGFSLLSMLVSMILGSILMSSMFLIYNGISRSARFVQRVSHEDIREVVMIEQMQKDFLGLATMWQNEQKKNEQGSTKDSTDNKNKFFYSVNKDDSLDFMTCITTNSLPSYAQNQPNFIRVVYRIENDPSRENMFRLMRKEMVNVSDEIVKEKLQSGIFSELAYGIRSIKMHYYFFKKQENTGVKDQADKGALQALGEMSEWNSNDEKMKEKTAAIVPYAIKVDITFEDNEGRQKEADFRIDILSDVSLSMKSFQPESQSNEKSGGLGGA